MTKKKITPPQDEDDDNHTPHTHTHLAEKETPSPFTTSPVRLSLLLVIPVVIWGKEGRYRIGHIGYENVGYEAVVRTAAGSNGGGRGGNEGSTQNNNIIIIHTCQPDPNTPLNPRLVRGSEAGHHGALLAVPVVARLHTLLADAYAPSSRRRRY